MSGGEETTEGADSSDSRDAEAIKGQPSKPFTEEDRQRVRERRKRHYTKRWYEKQLLAIANGELNPTKEQHKALLAFGRNPRLESASAVQVIALQTSQLQLPILSRVSM